MPRTAPVLAGHDRCGHLDEQPPVIVVRRVAFGDRVEQDRQRGVAPAVAAAPEDLLPVLLPLGNVAGVAVIEPLGRIVERRRRGVEFAVHELQVLLIARNPGQQGIDRRGHEQGVAPAPAFRPVPGLDMQPGLRREGDDRVGALENGAEHRRVAVPLVEHQVSLSDADVVGMVLPPSHAPAVAAADGEHELLAGLVARRFAPDDHAAVEGAVGPVLVAAREAFREVIAEVVDLPLRHAVGDLPVAFPGFGRRRGAEDRCPEQQGGDKSLVHAECRV